MDLPHLLAALKTCTPLQALDRLYQARYNGQVTFSLTNGSPRAIEVLERHRIVLRRPSRLAAAQRVLDSPRTNSADSTKFPADPA